ncbi:MAG: PorV/PorQ family protein [Ignavibacteriales bacterium]|jgi:hypothetical protein|nr:PorV/PorQ family protein [Ignavibacteriaceae bacterium]NLH61557.1 PorV/PorQ family protein [Ignavibacteriales bacterium]
MKRNFILMLIVLSSFSIGQDFKKTATSGFVFLNLPVTARSAALGESGVGLSNVNAAGIFSNPASTGFTDQLISFSTSYSPWIAEIKNYASAISYKSDFGVITAGFIGVDFGSMPKTKKIEGQRVYDVIGSFSASALAFGLSYSRMLTDRFSFGVTAKYVQETIDIYSASNFLFDGGILYYTGLGSLRLGAMIQNFGVDTKYKNEPFKMPSNLKLGLAGELYENKIEGYRVTGIVEAIHPNDNNERINCGLEVSYQEMLILRGGYKFFYDEETYSVGIGLNPKFNNYPIEFDFAYSDYGRLGDILRFSFLIGLQ